MPKRPNATEGRTLQQALREHRKQSLTETHCFVCGRCLEGKGICLSPYLHITVCMSDSESPQCYALVYQCTYDFSRSKRGRARPVREALAMLWEKMAGG